MRTRAIALATMAIVLGCSRTALFPDPPFAEPPPMCGDGDVTPGEECDDGNTVDTDGCRAGCVAARCGDGVVFAQVELCDDGNTTGGDGCEADCALPFCGDARVQPPEESCDDGNGDDTDACLSSCLLAFCGDGKVRAGVEACDDANTVRTDGCVDCRLAFCGDGEVHRRVEDCDDANMIESDGCTNACKRPVCGDGITSAGEDCDLGDQNRDAPAIVVRQGDTARAVQPRLGRTDVATHYDYRSASSHMGVERASEGRLFLYLDAEQRRLSLVLSYGADETQPDARVRVTLSGVPGEARVLVADDRGDELFASGAGTFTGNFSFESNSDGGAIGDLPFPGAWSITVVHSQLDGIRDLVFLDGDTRVPLDRNAPIVIEASTDGTRCNARCQFPRCGDDRLDPGELCDSADPLCGPTCGGP